MTERATGRAAVARGLTGKKTNRRKGIAAALILSALVAGFALVGIGADFTVSSSGSWQNYSPSHECTSVSGSEIRWGYTEHWGHQTCIAWDEQSGFTFTGDTNVTLVEDEWTTIAQFTHRNRVISGGNITTVQLELTLNGDINGSFTYDIDFDETTNTGGGCCDDVITFTTTPGTHTFTKDGRTYTLDLAFGDGSSSVETPENQDTTLDLKALVTCLDADLAVVKSDSPDPVFAEENLTYTITVTNNGPRDATGVVVTEYLPVGVTYVDGSASPSQGSYNESTHEWDVGGLDNGDSATLELTVVVDSDTTGTITNTVCVDGNEPDPDDSNDCDDETTTIQEPVCTDYDIAYDGSTYDGTNTTFTYTVTSYGPPAVSHVVIGLPSCVGEEDIFGTNYTPWDYVNPDHTTGVVGIKFDDTQVENESQVFSFTLKGYWPEGTVEAAIKAGSLVCYDSTTGPACPAPGIDIEKSTNGEDADSAPGPYIAVGETVTWTYKVTNTGNVDLTDIDVTDSVLGLISTIASLDVGDSTTLTETGTAVAGQYANTGTASVLFNGTTYSDSDLSHYVGVDGKIELEPTPGDWPTSLVASSPGVGSSSILPSTPT